MQLPFLNLDIEPTNRCNANCYFCPRDQTPHQGLMSPEVFARVGRGRLRPLALADRESRYIRDRQECIPRIDEECRACASARGRNRG